MTERCVFRLTPGGLALVELAPGLDRDLLSIPLTDRFAYDAGRNIFFLNMEGLSITSQEELDAVVSAVGGSPVEIGHRVAMVVNYDNFYIAPHLYEAYLLAFRGLADEYYESATRYTTSSFMRLKLSDGLSRRGLAPHIFESAHEAESWHSGPAT